MIKVCKIPSPYLLIDFIDHDIVKPLLLKSIEDYANKDPVNDDGGIITRTDYYNQQDLPDYWKILTPYVKPLVNKAAEILDLSSYGITLPWYQQYYMNDTHYWHRHPNSFYNFVYYVELPDDAPPTVFRNPFNKDQTHIPPAKEGQVIVFPATLNHCSPPSQSSDRKTIIAWNVQ